MSPVSPMNPLKRTPLYPLYADFPASRCIDFGGWELPVQFIGIQQEHDAVRQKAGLFDVSHMGEFEVSGRYAEAYLQRMTTNDVTRLVPGQAQYSLLCYEDGGVVDDLLVYRLSTDRFLLVVNASNLDKDLEWLRQHQTGDVTITDRSEDISLIALQGPLAAEILASATDAADPAHRQEIIALPSFHFIDHAMVCGKPAFISRTGYTGEDGFEIYAAKEDACAIWTGLLEAGKEWGLIPAGLGARDTLRFEAKLPLYGQELNKDITPLEAGLGYFVKLDKGDFIGRERLAEQKKNGIPRKLVGLEMIDRGIPRAHYPVCNKEGEVIGEVTTGTQSPTLKRNLGLALLAKEYAELGTEVYVDIRGKKLKAQIVKSPFYKNKPAVEKGGTPQ